MNYMSPTPKKWRKLGDSLLGVSTFIAGYGALESNKTLVIIALICGVGGKFLTNFFSE